MINGEFLVDEVTGRWDYSLLPSNVKLGASCLIERKSSFERYRSIRQAGLVLGDRVKVYTWTTFNIEPNGQLVVGSDCILVGAVFMCAEQITIGKRVTISYNVTIADCDFHPMDPDERKRDAVANSPFGDKSSRPTIITQPVEIADDVWVGIGAIILKGVKIGKGARIGAGAVVTRDVSEGARVFGNPAIGAEDA
jgi:acetyltransferase-like isoleucine patch superfamily enzyme